MVDSFLGGAWPWAGVPVAEVARKKAVSSQIAGQLYSLKIFRTMTIVRI
jgi:hypothetical protein